MTENFQQTVAEQTIVVALAAGKGSRMGKTDLAKVCFEIDGVPAINRTINTFKDLGFDKFMLIVGANAQSVLENVSKVQSDASFIYQNQQNGTGHAAKLAADALEKLDFSGNVLITMGDKYIEPAAIQALVEGFIKQQADMALLTFPKSKDFQAGGRVFLAKNGTVQQIIEQTDISKQAIADDIKKKLSQNKKPTPKQILDIINHNIPNTRKQKKATPHLLKWAKDKGSLADLKKILANPEFNFTIDQKLYTAKEIERKCKTLNPSLFLFKWDAFRKGVAMIKNDNAQAEFYLTDIVEHLTNCDSEKKYRIRPVLVNDPKCIQGFNSPDELITIQDHVRKQKDKKQTVFATSQKPKLAAKQFQPVTKWLEQVENNSKGLSKWLNKIYGDHEKLHAQKCQDLKNVLHCYGKRFGYDQKVCIVRAPGRLNLMGRHVDHRGGFNNFLAIDRETIAVAGLRDDNNVVAVNTKPTMFKAVNFNISDLIGRFAWSDWVNFVNSDWVRNLLYAKKGDWGNYIKAAVLRLQHKFQTVKVQGMNMAITGNVPIAAGLSSSSTIVVATLQAAIAMNNFELTSQQFIDLCGEGEWFVGSRGGAGDHAAIYLGQRAKIAQVANLPFAVENIVDAPADYQVVIANSHIKAPKSAGAKDQFNSRIAAYNLGLALLKQRVPEIADSVEYVRDIDPQKIGCTTSDIYRHLMKIPERMTRADFRKFLSKEHKDLCEVNFLSHAEPEFYNVRGVLLYGAAEVKRSRISIDSIIKGKIDEFGKLMQISHDGDRVAISDGNGKYIPWSAKCDDDHLNKMIAYLQSEDVEKVLTAQLYMQPGSYACSTPQIDRMVDIACSVPGVAGAQIAGAGLGGCIMILAKRNAVESLTKALIKDYYKPAKLTPAVLPCLMVEGAGLAEF
jgi:N-acetylgalactosamine kinase